MRRVLGYTRAFKTGLNGSSSRRFASTRSWLDGDAVVIEEAISSAEHDRLVWELLERDELKLKRFRKRKYDASHWDSAIVSYKETERSVVEWDPDNQQTLTRLHGVLEDHLVSFCNTIKSKTQIAWMKPHVIDLSEEGCILPHVDSVKFSGQVIAGLSLMSSRDMVLKREPSFEDEARRKAYFEDPEGQVLLPLPPRSLYILINAARFDFAHYVLANPNAKRRLSIIFRDLHQSDLEQLRNVRGLK